jgi:branched-chain amino acid transport system permease protein
MNSTLLRHLMMVVVAGAVLVAVTYQLDEFNNYLLASAAAFLCVTAGLTVLIGLNGQLSLGHGALMAVGAYTVALMQNMFSDKQIEGQWVVVVSLLAGVAAATVAGAVIGLAAARLRGPYLAGVTLAVALVVPAIAVTWSGVFNSDQGLTLIVAGAPEGLGADFPYQRWQAWLALVPALLVMLLLANLVRSRFGRNLRAVRDDEVAARLSGIHVARTQVLAFVVSAACAGLGGGAYAVLTGSVAPGAFSITLSLYLLMAIVIGGLGSLVGAVWGALLLVVLPELTTSLSDSFTVDPAAAQRLRGNLALAIFGVLLIVVMIVAPGGVQGLLRRIGRLLPLRQGFGLRAASRPSGPNPRRPRREPGQ